MAYDRRKRVKERLRRKKIIKDIILYGLMFSGAAVFGAIVGMIASGYLKIEI